MTPSPAQGNVSHRQQLEERSSSLDEFINSEIAVAKAMLDETYMDELNDVQRKRVERLLAYKRFSDQSKDTVKEESQNSSKTDSIQPMPTRNSDSQTNDFNADYRTNVNPCLNETKSLIPVRVKSIKKPIQVLQKQDTKRENVSLGTVESMSSLQAPHLVKEQVHVKQAVSVDVSNKSKQRVSKPLAFNQQEQLIMKDERAVEKQRHSKDSEQIEHPASVSLKDTGGIPQLPPTTKDLVKEVNQCQMEGDNEFRLNKHVLKTEQTASHECTQQTEALAEDNCSDSSEARVKLETKDPQMTDQLAHVQGEENTKQTFKTGPKVRKRSPSQKVLKFASEVMCVSTSDVQNPIKPHHMSKQPMVMKQSDEDEDEAKQSRHYTDFKSKYESHGDADKQHGYDESAEKQKCWDVEQQIQLEVEKKRQHDTETQQQDTNIKAQHRKEPEKKYGEKQKGHDAERKIQGEKRKEQLKDTPLKGSSATTKLILHREVRDNIEALTESTSSPNQGRKPCGAKRSAMTQTQWLMNAAVQTENDSVTYSASPEHSVTGYAGVHRRAQGMADPGRQAAQGGYSFAFAKRKENRKRTVKVSFTPRL